MNKSIKHLSDEHKRKISETMKKIGMRPPSMLGKHLSEKTKKRMSLAHKGKSLSEEHKKKVSKAFKGKHHTEETKHKMSEAHKGKNVWMKGKHHSEETKRKMSEAHKGKKPYQITEEIKKKISKALKGRISLNKGKTLSKETRKKISETLKSKKGGITPLKNLIRESFEYQKWRSNVFLRDNFTCQKCKEKGGELHAHHKKPFAKLIQEAREYIPFEIENKILQEKIEKQEAV